MKSILDNIDLLWDYLRKSAGDDVAKLALIDETIERLNPVWRAFSALHTLARACRLLTDDEVEELCRACDTISTASRTAYPKVHVQLKVHVIEAHLPAFVRRWRSSGLFVEDACESIHNIVNKLNRRYACIHGPALKAESKRRALEVFNRRDLQAIAADRLDTRKRGPYNISK